MSTSILKFRMAFTWAKNVERSSYHDREFSGYRQNRVKCLSATSYFSLDADLVLTLWSLTKVKVTENGIKCQKSVMPRSMPGLKKLYWHVVRVCPTLVLLQRKTALRPSGWTSMTYFIDPRVLDKRWEEGGRGMGRGWGEGVGGGGRGSYQNHAELGLSTVLLLAACTQQHSRHGR